jgi:hypothetical protein
MNNLGAGNVSNIDKQRVAAVRKLEELGYTFAAGDWMHPSSDVAQLQRSLMRFTPCW